MNFDEQLKTAIAEALEIETTCLHHDAVLTDIAEMDSLKMLTMIAALDDLGVSLHQQDVDNVKTFGDLTQIAQMRMK